MPIKNIYENIVSFESLLTALTDICKGRRYESDELNFWNDREKYLHLISLKLRNKKYPPDNYRSFYVYEPKLRKIVCCDFVTKLIQRAAYNAINPLITKTFISDTYSCIPGRGTLASINRLSGWVDYVSNRQNEKWYYLKMDVEKFFYRINHEALMKILRKKIADENTIDLLNHYICGASKPFGLPLGVTNPMDISDEDMLWDVGITIGGGMSHMLGNIYLDTVDQLAKRTLQIKYYIRYMDDVIILSNDKSQLHYYRSEIEKYLNDVLKLRLNRKTAIRPVSQGMEFVGCMIYPGRIYPRKSSTLRMKRRLKSIKEKYRKYEIPYSRARETIMSYKAYMKHCNCKFLDDKIMNDFVLTHSSKEEINAERELIGTAGDICRYY